MTQTDKFLIAKYLDENKANIIAKYAENMPIASIAELYNVAYSTIYFRLIKWGVKIRKHGGVRRKKGRTVRQKRRFSTELQAIMAENSRINNKHIKHVEFRHATEDQRLIDNILCHPIIG